MQMWERMPQSMRDEIDQKRKEDNQIFYEYRAYLKRNRIYYAIVGLALGITAGYSQLGFSPADKTAAIIVTALLGCLAGVVLNHFRGGLFVGCACFGGAYLAAFLIKGALGIIDFAKGRMDVGTFLAFAFGATFAIASGIVMGLRIAKDAFRSRKRRLLE